MIHSHPTYGVTIFLSLSEHTRESDLEAVLMRVLAEQLGPGLDRYVRAWRTRCAAVHVPQEEQSSRLENLMRQHIHASIESMHDALRQYGFGKEVHIGFVRQYTDPEGKLWLFTSSFGDVQIHRVEHDQVERIDHQIHTDAVGAHHRPVIEPHVHKVPVQIGDRVVVHQGSQTTNWSPNVLRIAANAPHPVQASEHLWVQESVPAVVHDVLPPQHGIPKKQVVAKPLKKPVVPRVPASLAYAEALDELRALEYALPPQLLSDRENIRVYRDDFQPAAFDRVSWRIVAYVPRTREYLIEHPQGMQKYVSRFDLESWQPQCADSCAQLEQMKEVWQRVCRTHKDFVQTCYGA